MSTHASHPEEGDDRHEPAFDADALYHLGVSQWQAGARDQGHANIVAALASKPGVADRWLFLAAIEQELGRLPAAEEALKRGIRLDPNRARAHNNLGVLMAVSGRLDEALASFHRAVALEPRGIEWINNLGSAMRDTGDPEGAVAQYDAALVVDPGYVPTLVNLGGARYTLGHHDLAEDAYRAAIERDPHCAAAWNGLGTVLLARRRFGDALTAFERATTIDPSCFEAFANASEACISLERIDAAEDWATRALTLRPNHPDAMSCLARIARDRGNRDSAKDILRRAVATNPGHAASWINLAAVENHDSLDIAEECIQKALAIDPSSATAQYNLATILLLRDDYERGFRLFESRFETFTREFAASRGLYETLNAWPTWSGDPLEGRKLLVWTEQGLGDSLMMMRYLPMLHGLGAASVTVACDQPLHRMLVCYPGVDHVVSPIEAPASDFDVHCGFMSLPANFGTSYATVPRSVPYVTVPPEVSGKWKLGPVRPGMRRVGLCWAGSKTLRDDTLRSIPLDNFGPVLGVPRIEWVNLHRDAAATELEHAPIPFDNTIAGASDLLDSAAIVAQLDLVITVDTMIAHLAGALGIPVWMLNRYRGDWRWGLASDRTPWYPSMRLFRQGASESWNDVLHGMRAQVSAFANASV